MLPPIVSVVLNCHNGEPYLAEALGSVVSQTYDSWDIVFWDDRSTDRTAEIAQRLGPRLRYFRSDDPVPVGTLRNRAVAQARGRYLAFIDSDDVWFPSHLSRLIPLLEANPRCALVWADAFHITAAGEPIRRFTDNCRFYRGHRLRELYREAFVAPGSTTVLRADCLRAVGGFPNELHICSEMEAFLRLASRWELDFSPIPSALYRHHDRNISSKVLAMNREEKSILEAWSQAQNRQELTTSDFAYHRMRLALKDVREYIRTQSLGMALRAATQAARPALAHPSILASALRMFVVRQGLYSHSSYTQARSAIAGDGA